MAFFDKVGNLEGKNVYATFDYKKAFEDGEIVYIEWENPDHPTYIDHCICAIRTITDEAYNGINFVYIVLGSYVDATPENVKKIYLKNEHDRLGIVESSIRTIRIATNAERKYYQDVLESNMLKYDSKNKKIVRYKLDLVDKANYYILSYSEQIKDDHKIFTFVPKKITYFKNDDIYDKKYMFPTYDACLAACDKINNSIDSCLDNVFPEEFE